MSTFLPNMSERFKKRVDELATVTQYQVDKARSMVRELVGGEIKLHAAADGADRFLMEELRGDYSLPGAVGLWA